MIVTYVPKNGGVVVVVVVIVVVVDFVVGWLLAFALPRIRGWYIFFIFHISYHLRRVALRQKPFFKGPSDKNLITIYN